MSKSHQSAVAQCKPDSSLRARSVIIFLKNALILAALVLAAAAAKTGECAWCPSGPCLTSASCGSCTCLIGGGESKGRCYAEAD